MITLTDDARRELEAYFEGKERGGIRIYLAPGGCSGPRLALALDEPNEQDKTFEEGGFTFCIEAGLLEQVQSVKIDLTYMGFVLEPGVALPAAGGSCGSGCCGSCGRH